MTDSLDPDYLIEVASAFVDGEATPEEVSLVETNPDIQQVVSALQANRQRAIDESVTPPPSDVQRRQISAALDVFDEVMAASSAPASAPPLTTVPPADHPQVPEPSQTPGAVAATFEAPGPADTIDLTSPAANETDAVVVPLESRRAMPGWLAVAAVAVISVGGIGFAVSQFGGDTSDDAGFEAASLDLAEEERVSPSAESASALADEGGGASATTEADSFASDTDDSDTDDSEADDSAEEALETDVPSDFIGLPVTPETAIPFDEGTELDEVVAVYEDQQLPALELSHCFLTGGFDDATAEIDIGGRPIGFIPSSIGGELLEVFVIELADGSLSPIGLTPDCQLR